jgi:hypothetical protein
MIKKILPPLALAVLTLSAVACREETPAVAGLEVQPAELRLGQGRVLPVRFNWTPSAALEEDAGPPMVFVHLLDSGNKVVRTFDHAFPERWREGTPVAYDIKLYQSVLAPPLSPGSYRLTVGLFGRGKHRWALQGLGEEVDRNEYVAAQVEVPAQEPGPQFNFSATWLPVEPGGDRQLVARRWLIGRGGIRMVDVRSPGTLWMVVRIPPAEGADEKLVLKEGQTIPSVLIRGTCGGVEMNVSGPGPHEIEVPIQDPPDRGVCRVILLPNFHYETPNVRDKRTISLENLAWMPAGRRRAAPAPAAPRASAAPAPAAPAPSGSGGRPAGRQGPG